MPIPKLFLLLGSLSALLGVAVGAFGAHALKARLSTEMLAVYHTGVQYHFYHALGLILVGLIALQLPESPWIKWSGWLLVAGMVLFSGSLYVLAISGVRWWGAFTPVGGAAFIAGWAACALAVGKAL